MRSTHGDDAREVARSSAAGSRPQPEATVGLRGLRYLPGLDGIRAIAVIGVLLFHLGLSRAQGGFLGVDLFFVLSGFLITSLLLQEIGATGRLNYGRFYLRRARRLLPALGATLVLSLLLAWFFARDAFAQVLRDIPFALFYVINWAYMFRHQSYFQAMGRPPLLQHLWSLAIEEQFYLIWPSVVLLLAYLFRRHLRRAVLVTAASGAVISTALLAWVSARNGYPDLADPSPAYFATHTHAMGILTGAALAALMIGRFTKRAPSTRERYAANTAAVVGVVAVIAAYVFLSQYTSWLYRGGLLVFAVVASIGVAGAAVPGAAAGRALGVAPLRYIGQRSYGLYLYHWPIFMVLRPGEDTALAGWANAVLRLTATFVVAELSYRFLEMPFRNGALLRWWRGARRGAAAWRGRPEARRRLAVVLVASLAAIAVLIGVGNSLAPATAVAAHHSPPVPGVSYGPFAPPPSTRPSTPAASGKQPHTAWVPMHAPAIRTSTLLVGDSVLLGATFGVQREFKHSRVNAVVGRQPREFPKLLALYRARRELPPIVVVHMGTNGYVSAPILRHVLNQLTHVRRVILVSVHVDRPWADASNAMIYKLAKHYPNVVVADWAKRANGHRDWFVADGVHLTPRGVNAYSAMLALAAVATGPLA